MPVISGDYDMSVIRDQKGGMSGASRLKINYFCDKRPPQARFYIYVIVIIEKQ